MLKRIRQTLAVAGILIVTLLFVDFTGTARAYLGWMAKIQFIPALLALNAGVIIGLVLLTLLFGRLYCSVICPLGIMQDGFARLGKFAKKNRYSWSPAKSILRYAMLIVMIIAIAVGIGVVVAVLEPYSAYGRIVQSLVAPVYVWINNLFAAWAERAESYSFYTVDVWLRSIATLAVAIVTLVALAILAWRNGRTYCNTICPVGTLLGLISRFSIFRPVIDVSKCTGCGLCARNCKGSCINPKEHSIDYSRCVVCFDCIGKCNQGAISYAPRRIGRAKEPAKKEASAGVADSGRRQFLTLAATATASATVSAATKTTDGGLAVIVDKEIPARKTKIVPPGALSIRNLEDHCTACQLCVSACPNGVLRPSEDLESFMQPEASYERGYCRPECTACSNACPAGAIKPITREEKSSVAVGHAVWIKNNCLPVTEGVECGNCARHCPSGAIQMVALKPDNPESVKIPVVNTAKCIGCGACENLCPSRPFSAIYVEGHETHRSI